VGVRGTVEVPSTLAQLLFAESLLELDWHGRAIGRLASDSTWLDEGRTLQVRLRPGVKFHDGVEVTAEIVAAILQQQRKRDRTGAFEHVTAIEAPDPATLLFRLSRVDTFVVDGIADALIVDDRKPDIGTGPFRILTRTPLVQAEKNETYYRGTPGIDQIRIVTYDTQRAAWAAMMGGEVDMVQEVNREVVEFLEGSSRFAMYSSIRPFYIPLVFNLRHPILSHVEVRRALVEGIDRQEIVKKVMRGGGEVTDDPVWPRHWAYNASSQRYSYDPESARRRLEAAGFPIRTNVEPGRMPSRFEIKCLFYNKDFQFERIAMLVQRQLARIGVDMVLEGMDEKPLVTRVGSGDFDSYTFQMASGRSFAGTYRFWHSPVPGSPVYQNNGYTGADDILEQLREAGTDAEVRAGVTALRRRFFEDVPAAFLTWTEVTRAVDASFDVGDKNDPDIFANMWRWHAAERVNASR
jgi:peptide/nickel transport system substrate-binding protein